MYNQHVVYNKRQACSEQKPINLAQLVLNKGHMYSIYNISALWIKIGTVRMSYNLGKYTEYVENRIKMADEIFFKKAATAP